MRLLVERFGCRVGNIGRQVRLAALPGGALELGLDGVDQPAVVV